eukprot:4615770-Prymnesium_polylepis.2
MRSERMSAALRRERRRHLVPAVDAGRRRACHMLKAWSRVCGAMRCRARAHVVQFKHSGGQSGKGCLRHVAARANLNLCDCLTDWHRADAPSRSRVRGAAGPVAI